MKKISFLIILFAAFIFINTAMSQTKRYVKASATGTGDGSSWSNASSNLQAMIDASASNDQVWIAKGTYKPTKNVAYTAGHVALTDPRFKSFDLSNGVKLYGGFYGNEATMGQRNPLNKTFFSGDFLGNDVGLTNNSENAYHVVFSANHNVVATLDGITITGGNTNGQPQAYTNNNPWYSEITADGGAIYSYSAGIFIQTCAFISNNSSHYGGAIYSYDVGGDYNNCLFLNNNALDGAAAYTGALGSSLYSHFVNCTMFGNSSNAAICKATIDDNTYMYNCIIWGNTVTGLSAGNYYVFNSDVQNAFASGTRADAATTFDANPVFTNAADVDGADNILGTADDGLIPQCGQAIGAGTNGQVAFTKDFKNGTRIVNGNVDMGAYETSLTQAINSLTIYSLSNHATTENLPAGLCQGKTANFSAFTGGNSGVFQWTQNGINVGTNSGDLAITSFHIGDQLQLTLTNPANTCGAGGIVHSNVITLANVSSGVPVIPSNITGPTNACPYFDGTPVTYKIDKAPGGIKYHWYVGSGAPGVNIVSHPAGGGVNDTIVTVTFDAGWTSTSGVRYLYVSTENWCGVSSAKKIQIQQLIPQSVGAVTGPTDPCPYMQSASNPSGFPANYTIRKVSGASSYVWTVPSGTTINSHPAGTGENDTSIIVTFNSSFVSGTLSVQAVNYCGSKPPRTVSLSRRAPGTPGSITGPTSVCAFMQSPSNPPGTPVDYTIRKVLYASSYTWTIPVNTTATHPGGAGINDTILRITYKSSFTGGVITIKSNNNCATSATRSLSILYKLPGTPGTITAGTPTGCLQRRITYSIASLPSYATSVQWIAPASGSIISGQGTLSVVVEFAGPTSVADTIRVMGVNDCGTSSQRKLKVAVLTGSCRYAGSYSEQSLPAEISKTKPATTNNISEPDVTVMPNPSQQHFTLQLKAVDIKIPAMIHVTDATGRTIEIKHNIQNTIIIGDAYKPGIYFATIIQGEKRKVVRLVKL